MKAANKSFKRFPSILRCGSLQNYTKFLSNYAEYYLWKRRTLGIGARRERGNKIQANVPLLRLRTLVGITPGREQVC